MNVKKLNVGCALVLLIIAAFFGLVIFNTIQDSSEQVEEPALTQEQEAHIASIREDLLEAQKGWLVEWKDGLVEVVTYPASLSAHSIAGMRVTRLRFRLEVPLFREDLRHLPTEGELLGIKKVHEPGTEEWTRCAEKFLGVH